jgi:hypothetical protein
MQGIIHRDIKPENIGVHHDLKVHLFDWGEAVTMSDVDNLADRELSVDVGVAGTPLFMPPESLQYLTAEGKERAQLRSTLTTKLDIWGLGTVLYFLLSGRDLFLDTDEWELQDLAEIANSSTPWELPEGCTASCAARDFVQCCLRRAPENRLSAKELLQHPWLCGATTLAEVEIARQAAAMAAAAKSKVGARVSVLVADADASTSFDWAEEQEQQEEHLDYHQQLQAKRDLEEGFGLHQQHHASSSGVPACFFLDQQQQRQHSFHGGSSGSFLGSSAAAAAGADGVTGCGSGVVSPEWHCASMSAVGLDLQALGCSRSCAASQVDTAAAGKPLFGEEAVCEIRLRPSASAATLSLPHVSSTASLGSCCSGGLQQQQQQCMRGHQRSASSGNISFRY